VGVRGSRPWRGVSGERRGQAKAGLGRRHPGEARELDGAANDGPWQAGGVGVPVVPWRTDGEDVDSYGARKGTGACLAGCCRPGERVGERSEREGAGVDDARRRTVVSRACRCAPWRVLDVLGASRSRRCRVPLRPGPVQACPVGQGSAGRQGWHG
jgi:hypothetical protein